MGIGAFFAAMNTLYAAVTYRTQEIATLRVLGFRPATDPALVRDRVAVAGRWPAGRWACLIALPLNSVSTGTANWSTFSEIAFAFQVTPRLLGAGIGFRRPDGLFGGFFPARQASRQNPAAALREA